MKLSHFVATASIALTPASTDAYPVPAPYPPRPVHSKTDPHRHIQAHFAARVRSAANCIAQLDRKPTRYGSSSIHEAPEFTVDGDRIQAQTILTDTPSVGSYADEIEITKWPKGTTNPNYQMGFRDIGLDGNVNNAFTAIGAASNEGFEKGNYTDYRTKKDDTVYHPENRAKWQREYMKVIAQINTMCEGK